MPSTKIWESVRSILFWPVDAIRSKILIPIIARYMLYGVDVACLKRKVFPETILGVPVMFKVSLDFASRIEVASLHFVKSQTTIPVPKVYTRFVQPNPPEKSRRCNRAVIVMERFPGRSLRPVWHTLTNTQKRRIFDQTISYVRQLQALPQPEPKGWIRSLCGYIYDQRLDHRPFGPFENEKQFNEWRYSVFDRLPWIPPLRVAMERFLEEMPSNHRIVFSHGDMHLQNILVDVRGTNTEDANVVAIIDWEMAAWMPEYWDGIKMRHGQLDRDWCQFVDDAFPGYNKVLELDDDLMMNAGR